MQIDPHQSSRLKKYIYFIWKKTEKKAPGQSGIVLLFITCSHTHNTHATVGRAHHQGDSFSHLLFFRIFFSFFFFFFNLFAAAEARTHITRGVKVAGMEGGRAVLYRDREVIEAQGCG